MKKLRHVGALTQQLLTIDRSYLLERAGVPSDPRGIVLGCGFAAAAGGGVIALCNRDPLGWAYLAAAGGGYLFLQTRLMPAFLWLLVAGAGVWGAWAGAPGAWVEVFYGLLLTGVAIIPVPEPDGDMFRHEPQPNLSRTSTLAEESPSAAQVTISSLGRFQVLVAGHDLTARVLDKRTIGGLWCYLLVLAARGPEGSISRTTLAAHFSPGLSKRQQRERLRRQLWDLQRDLGPEIGGLVVANRSTVRLEIGRATFDVALMQQLCAELREKFGDSIDGDLLIQVRRALDESANHQFLPDFERLAVDAGIDLTVARRTLAEVRSQVNFLRAELARLLSEQQVRSRAPLKGELA